MAIGWLALLKYVPWSDVIANAPVVVDGAKKLWSATARKTDAAAAADDGAAAVATQQDERAQLLGRVAALEREQSELRQRLLASSELIKALAEQNAQAVRQIEVIRVRVLWLAGALAVTAVFTGLCVAVLLGR